MKQKRVLSIVLSTCLLTSNVIPVLAANQTESNTNLLQTKSGKQYEFSNTKRSTSQSLKSENNNIATPSEAEYESDLFSSIGEGFDSEWLLNEFAEKLPEMYPTDTETTLYLNGGSIFPFDYYYEYCMDVGSENVSYSISASNFLDEETIYNSSIDSTKSKDNEYQIPALVFQDQFDIKNNQVYHLSIEQNVNPDLFLNEDIYCYEPGSYELNLLPLTHDALEEIEGVLEIILPRPEFAELVYDSYMLVHVESIDENEIDEFGMIGITEDETYLDQIGFVNRLSEAVRVKFTGNKDYFVNGTKKDPSKFSFTVEEFGGYPSYSENNLSYDIQDNYVIDSDTKNALSDGTIESKTFKVPLEEYIDFNVFEETSAPDNTFSHSYDYDETEYFYEVYAYNNEPRITSDERKVVLEYYNINTEDYDYAKQDENGVFIIPGNNFVNKEEIKETNLQLFGSVKFDSTVTDADYANLKYRITGWPGVNGYLDVSAQNNGIINFPDVLTISYDEIPEDTITIHQIITGNANPDYLYDTSIYQFELKVVKKEEVTNYGISTDDLSGIDFEFVLLRKDYKDNNWNLVNYENGTFIIDGIDFLNKKIEKCPEKFIVQFNTNGGNPIDAYVDVETGLIINEPTAPVRSGYQFIGWYKDSKFETPWNFESDTVTSNTILYAKWKKINSSSGGGPGSSSSKGNNGYSGYNGPGITNSSIDYEWFKDNNGVWFYKNLKTNTLKKGWHLDPNDGYWYYLDPVDGHMYIGWNLIDGKWYYFRPSEIVENQTWFIDTNGHWKYHNPSNVKPFGSMYANEKTPDGYYVNSNGEWIQ